MNCLFFPVLILSLLVWLSPAMLLAQTLLPYQRVLLTFSTQAEWPGTSNMIFNGFNVYQGAGNGSFSFRATVYEPGVGYPSDPSGMYAGTPENFRLIARDNAVAPGSGSATYDLQYIFVQSHGDGGAVGFKGALRGTGVDSTNDRGIWLASGNTTAYLARTGNQAPGTPAGVTFTDLELPGVNQTNRAIFRATVAGPGVVTGQNDTGIWSGTVGGGTSLVVRGGGAAPAYPTLTLSDVTVPIQGNSNYAYRGTLTGPGVTTDTDNVIYHGTPGNWSVLVREGDATPGFPTGSTFFNTGFDMRMSRTGQVWFTSAASGPGVTGLTNQGLWTGTPGNIQMVYREGEQAPGLAAGMRFRLNPTYSTNNNGQFAMITPVSDTGGSTVAMFAYYTGSVTNLSLVAYHGQQAPGLPAGVLLDSQTTGYQPVISDNGAVALYSHLIGTGVDASNDYGIFAFVQGQLKLVVRQGDQVDVDNGPGTDLRTISSLFFPSATFADDGRLLWGAYFNNGTQGAFYTTVAVPEPATLLLGAAVLGLVAHQVYRRQRRKQWQQEVVVEG